MARDARHRSNDSLDIMILIFVFPPIYLQYVIDQNDIENCLMDCIVINRVLFRYRFLFTVMPNP